MKKYEVVIEYLEKNFLNAENNAALPPENAIAEALNVSRYPVRQAIKTLESRGTIVTLPGVGSFMRGREGVPSKTKSNLRQKLICVATFSLGPSTAQIMMGLQDVLLPRGYMLTNIYDLQHAAVPGSANSISAVPYQEMQGMFVIPPSEFEIDHQQLMAEINKLQANTGMKIVVLERTLQGYVGSQAVIDNAAGSALAVEQLVNQGIAPIAYIGKTDYHVGRERFKGYRRGLLENDRDFDATLVACDDSKVKFIDNLPQFVDDSMTRILSGHPDCRAFVCFSFLIAYRCFLYMKQHRKLTTDLKLYGYDLSPVDDREFYDYYTVIERPMYEVGTGGAQIMLDLLAEQAAPELFIVKKQTPYLQSAVNSLIKNKVNGQSHI